MSFTASALGRVALRERTPMPAGLRRGGKSLWDDGPLGGGQFGGEARSSSSCQTWMEPGRTSVPVQLLLRYELRRRGNSHWGPDPRPERKPLRHDVGRRRWPIWSRRNGLQARAKLERNLDGEHAVSTSAPSRTAATGRIPFPSLISRCGRKSLRHDLQRWWFQSLQRRLRRGLQAHAGLRRRLDRERAV